MRNSLSSRGMATVRGTHRAALVLGLAVGLAAAIGPAQADKVGVAAAVNPDAFSNLSDTPNKQLNIGKSIFFNERINTTTSGLVQVLLVDGSTFTVGPNSDLVIDKFVYNPRKKTGEIVATFSKGTMRFIGGKISKNEGGVTVKTPSGALAIRGGMVQGSVSGNKGVFSFLYGVQMSFTSNNGQTATVYENGYTLDLTGGTPTIRPTTPQDTNFFMAALSSGSGTTGNNNTTPGTPDPNQFQQTTNYSEIISEATATQIQDEIQKQIDNRYNTTTDNTTTDNTTTATTTTPTPSTTTTQTNDVYLGYAGGTFLQTGGSEGDPPAGTLANLSPTEVALLFDSQTHAFAGAHATLYADAGEEGAGGAKVTFVPINVPANVPGLLPSSGLFAGLANASTMTVFQDTTGNPPQLKTPETLTSAQATLFGVSGASGVLCKSCDFMKWGAWVVAFQAAGDPVSNVAAAGWWVAGDIPTVGQLPTQGSAYYDGHTIGNVASYDGEGWETHVATGDVHMDWDFGPRSGNLAISNFDATGPRGPLNLSGTMNMPGRLSAINSFSGPLSGTLGSDHCAPSINGGAAGSFVANGADKTAGVIGNWNAANQNYKATGIFGASRSPTDR